MIFDLKALKVLCAMLTLAVVLQTVMLAGLQIKIHRLERATFPIVQVR